MGEFIWFSANNVYRRIGEMIRNGDVANMLIRPVNFAGYMFSEECSNFMQIIINATFGIILGIAFAGMVQMTIIQSCFVIIAVILAIIMQKLIHILIGMIAFFTEENKGFYLIISKIQLLIILTPIEFYPSVVQKLFYALPFVHPIYIPSKLLVHFDLNLRNKAVMFRNSRIICTNWNNSNALQKRSEKNKC